MGIEVVLEDGSGKTISSLQDPRNILHRLLPRLDDPGYECLNRVDWYGDTMFNRYQIPVIKEELRRLANIKQDPEEHDLIQKLEALIARCESQPHLYLKFYGD
jgi:hypothetical protein